MAETVETNSKKNRKKLPLAAQIFIALILAIIVGLLRQKHSDSAVNYIKPQLRSAAGIIPDGYACKPFSF